MYSSVMRTVLWPAILDASMLDPPTSCRHVILARRKECGPRPGKSQPSAAAAFFRDCRTPESHNESPLPSRPREDHGIWLRVLGRGLHAVAINQISQRKRPLAGARFRIADVAAPVALHACPAAQMSGGCRVFLRNPTSVFPTESID